MGHEMNDENNFGERISNGGRIQDKIIRTILVTKGTFHKPLEKQKQMTITNLILVPHPNIRCKNNRWHLTGNSCQSTKTGVVAMVSKKKKTVFKTHPIMC